MTACSPKSGAAYRRYLRRFWPATGAYVVAIALATWLIPDGAHASPLTVGIALLPGLGVVAMIRQEDVEAFWVVHVDTRMGTVLAGS